MTRRMTNDEVEIRAFALGHSIRYNRHRAPGALAGSTRTTYLTRCSCGASLGNVSTRREAEARFRNHARPIAEAPHDFG